MHVEDGPHGVRLVRVDVLLNEVEAISEQSVRGGGGGGGMLGVFAINPIWIASSTRHFHQTFVPNPDGAEVLLVAPTSEWPMRQGHWLSIVWGLRDGFEPIMIYGLNQDTRLHAPLAGPMRGKFDNRRGRVLSMAEALYERRFPIRVVLVFLGIVILTPYLALFYVSYSVSGGDILYAASAALPGLREANLNPEFQDKDVLGSFTILLLPGSIAALCLWKIVNRAWERLFLPGQRAFEKRARRLLGL